MNKTLLTAIKIILTPVAMGAASVAIWAVCYAMVNFLEWVGFATEVSLTMGGLSAVLLCLILAVILLVYCGVSEIVDKFISGRK